MSHTWGCCTAGCTSPSIILFSKSTFHKYIVIYRSHITAPVGHWSCRMVALPVSSPAQLLGSQSSPVQTICLELSVPVHLVWIPNMGEVEYNGNHLGATKVSATCGAFGTRNIIAFLQKDRMSLQSVMFSGCDKRILTSGVWNSGLCLAFR